MTQRAITYDYAKSEDDDADHKFYTTTQLGPKRSITPEGFLLCQDVPLARAGEMLYGPDETPIEADAGDVVRITRTVEELFRPETLASFNGKPVTNEHPPEEVTPDNWMKYAKGTLMNVRRGEGENENLMVGDLLVTDPKTIQDINNDKREVSLGYDASYTKTGPGRGTQSNIIGNHVALVDRGRCGPRCAINDHDTQLKKEQVMPQIVNTGGARRRLDSRVVRQVLDNAMLEMERMQGGAQNSLAKDEEGEYGEELTGGGTQNIHIHLEGSTAPAGKTGAIMTEGASTGDDIPSGPEFPENKNAGNMPNRMPSQDDPTEMRFQRIESVLAQILQHLQGGAQPGDDQAPDESAGGPNMGHGEPDGDEPGSANQAPGARAGESDRFDDAAAEEMAEEVNGVSSGDDAPMTADRARKVRDSQPLEVSYRQLASDCEILAPGYRLATFDAAVHPVDTIQFMCNTRKRVLDLAYMSYQGKQAIDNVMRGRVFDSSVMDCRCLRKTFDAAASVLRAQNNAPAVFQQQNQQQNLNSAPRTTEELNAFMRQHYARTRPAH